MLLTISLFDLRILYISVLFVKYASIKFFSVMLKNAINKGIVSHEPFVSLEFHPPKIDELVDFFKTVEYVTECNPLFISISWHIQNNPRNCTHTFVSYLNFRF